MLTELVPYETAIGLFAQMMGALTACGSCSIIVPAVSATTSNIGLNISSGGDVTFFSVAGLSNGTALT